MTSIDPSLVAQRVAELLSSTDDEDEDDGTPNTVTASDDSNEKTVEEAEELFVEAPQEEEEATTSVSDIIVEHPDGNDKLSPRGSSSSSPMELEEPESSTVYGYKKDESDRLGMYVQFLNDEFVVISVEKDSRLPDSLTGRAICTVNGVALESHSSFQDAMDYLGNLKPGKITIVTREAKQSHEPTKQTEPTEIVDLTQDEETSRPKRGRRPKKVTDDGDATKCARRSSSRGIPTEFQPTIGMRIRKKFEDGKYYTGTVKSGPQWVVNKGKQSLEYLIIFDDGDKEDMARRDVFRYRITPTNPDQQDEDSDAATKPAATVESEEEPEEENKKPAAKKRKLFSDYDKAKRAVCALPGMNEAIVTAAMDKVGEPYGLQAIMNEIRKARSSTAGLSEERISGKFDPERGMRVRKMFDGKNYYGTVTNDGEYKASQEDLENGKEERMVMYWEVTFEDGDVDDMTWDELFQCRADRPLRTVPSRGRQLQMVELFSGRGVVSQEFCERRWMVESYDNNEWSNATEKEDILKVSVENMHFVPDFVWASPPCHTYSLMAGGKHRSVKDGNYEISEEARFHNYLFVQMASILHTVKQLHPHAIFVIENPRALMNKMPLMKELVETLGLYESVVDYCAFGRDDKKPTCLWTNDFGLHSVLNEFKCEKKCPYSIERGGSGVHPIGVRKYGTKYNAAAIPQALAEEVAEYVSAKFYFDRIRHTKPKDPKDSAGATPLTMTEATAVSDRSPENPLTPAVARAPRTNAEDRYVQNEYGVNTPTTV